MLGILDRSLLVPGRMALPPPPSPLPCAGVGLDAISDSRAPRQV